MMFETLEAAAVLWHAIAGWGWRWGRAAQDPSSTEAVDAHYAGSPSRKLARRDDVRPAQASARRAFSIRWSCS